MDQAAREPGGALGGAADAHAREAATVAAGLGVDPAIGLSAAEAGRRAVANGPNALDASRAEPFWRMVVDSLTEPFVVLLALAGGLAIVVGEVRDGLLVLAGLLPIVGADVVTEYRGERALEALREASAPVARVRRDGAVVTVPAAEVVTGDVVLLQGGDVVPADIRTTRADRLLLDRSVLTGESIPEEGRVQPDPPDAPLASRRSVAYSGTSVVGGRGEGVVVATGRATEFGRIAGLLASSERRRSPLQRELDRLVRILLVVALALIAFTAGVGFLRGHPLGENILAGISSAIAAIPEEPPVLLAVILGLGAYRLLRRGVLVRRLNAEETLGAVDLIVTDKTGTLTQNRLEVSSVRTLDGPVEDGPARRTLLEEALRAEEDAWPGEEIAPASFTRALRAAVGGAGGETELDARTLLEAEPASSALPITRTRARRNGQVEELALGAPEVVLDYVDRPVPVLERRAHWAELIETAASAGERLVALARRIDEGPWEIRALVGFADPIRPGITDAMATARRARIQVVVVTGDHPRTAATIAREAGLDADHIVTGEEMADLGRRAAGGGAGRHPRRRPLDARPEAAPRARRPRPRPDRRRDRRRRERRPGAARGRRRGRDGLGDRRRARGVRPRPGRRLVRHAHVRPRGGPADRRQRPEGPRVPGLDPRRVPRVHPHLDDLRGRAPGPAAAPDPVDGAVHRPVDVDRIRT